MKSPRMVDIRNYLSPETKVIQPDSQSPEGRFVPEVVSRYGRISGFLKVLVFLFPSLIKTLTNIRKSYKSIKRNPAPGKSEIQPEDLNDFKEFALRLGCSDIGYTKVPRSYIFSNKVTLFDNAIVLTMNMKKSIMKKAPSVTTSMEVWRAYAELGRIVNQLAAFLRKRGYQAQAGPALGGESNYPYLAQKAGMGYLGKHGLLISKENGLSQRIAVVYTNIENLPATDSDDYKWIPEFCRTCNRCVRTCPAQAIYQETRQLENGGKRHIDYKKCAMPFSTTGGCSVCIKECPFLNSDYERIQNAWQRKKEKE